MKRFTKWMVPAANADVYKRQHEDMFNNGLDIVVIARSTARDISYHETERALLHLGGFHKVINR